VDADEALLDTYEAERRPLATDVLRGTTTSTRLQVSDSPLMRFIRRRVLVPIVNLPSFQRKASQIASKLWVSYRRGPLGGGVMSRLGRRPRPGDRVPDLTCVRADGSQTRLHAEVGRQWSLLTPAGGADDHLAEAQKRLDDHVVALTDDERRDIWLRCSAVPPVSSTSRATTFGCDDIDNLSTTALDQMSDAAAHATITLAQSTELINGKRGKATSGRSSPSSRRPGR
jgi:hypothetical protein